MLCSLYALAWYALHWQQTMDGGTEEGSLSLPSCPQGDVGEAVRTCALAAIHYMAGTPLSGEGSSPWQQEYEKPRPSTPLPCLRDMLGILQQLGDAELASTFLATAMPGGAGTLPSIHLHGGRDFH